MDHENDALRHGPTDATLALRALARFPQRRAFVWDGGEMLYAEAAERIGGMQAVLAELGVGPGGCVAVLSANRAEYWCAVIAVQALGAAVSNLHPMAPRKEHADQIARLSPAVVIVDAADFGARALELAGDCPNARHMTLGGGGPCDLVQSAERRPGPPRDLSRADHAATMNFTGGTTGRPKCVVRTGGGLASMTLTILADFDLPDCPQYLAVAPISHVGGTKIVPVLLRGGTVHVMRGFDPGAVLRTISAAGINMTLMVPTMIYALLDHPEFENADLRSLELLLYGAAPMAPERLRQGIAQIGPVFAQLYGQTECYPIAMLPRADHDPDRPDLLAACGHVVSTALVRLLGPDGAAVPAGVPAEICVRAPMLMQEYHDNPDETAKAVAGGWLRTGDIAICDDQGRLTIVDRAKDMIVTGGFNVYPREVEDILTAQAGVAMAAVIGVPDDKWGEAVVAFVVPRPGAAPDPRGLQDMVKQQKGAVYAPKAVHLVGELPLTGLGKVDKVALRAPFWEGRARRI